MVKKKKATKKAKTSAKTKTNARPRTKTTTKTKTKTNTKRTATQRVTAGTIPTTELNTWVKTHLTWNHEEWTNLLNHLRTKGYSETVDTETGRTAIGNYLETQRSKHIKLPTTELNTWLRNRRDWSHSEWLGLLDDLRKKGHHQLVDTELGSLQIGKYLETNRA